MINKEDNAGSYSRNTKLYLSENIPKSKCCRRALCCGIILYRNVTESFVNSVMLNRLIRKFAEDERFIVTSPDDLMICENCRRYFLRGAFLACGFVSNPDSGRYQLELVLPDNESADYVAAMIDKYAASPLRTIRAQKHVLYYRDNEEVADFLNIIGAQNSSYDFVNAKIKRSYDNDAQRAANCDVANIARTVGAAVAQIEAIEQLKVSGRFESLPDNLKITASLRCEHPDCNLQELADMHNPPITKSGVNHRLAKIVSMVSEDR